MKISDIELWRVHKGDRTIACRRRDIPHGTGWEAYVALELRVEHNGEIYLTETHRDHARFHRRVEELRDALLDSGWTVDVDEVVR